MTTDFSKKVEILGQFYQNYKDDNVLADFMEFNDLGLPLAFLAAENLCQITDEGIPYIEETWMLFLAGLELEDTGFETLDQIFTRKED